MINTIEKVTFQRKNGTNHAKITVCDVNALLLSAREQEQLQDINKNINEVLKHMSN